MFVRGFRGERRAAEILAMVIISPAISIFFCLPVRGDDSFIDQRLDRPARESEQLAALW